MFESRRELEDHIILQHGIPVRKHVHVHLGRLLGKKDYKASIAKVEGLRRIALRADDDIEEGDDDSDDE